MSEEYTEQEIEYKRVIEDMVWEYWLNTDHELYFTGRVLREIADAIDEAESEILDDIEDEIEAQEALEAVQKSLDKV